MFHVIDNIIKNSFQKHSLSQKIQSLKKRQSIFYKKQDGLEPQYVKDYLLLQNWDLLYLELMIP